MGWSDIVPGANYEEPALRAAVVKVVEDLDLSDCLYVAVWQS
jgi:hypothetical protein